ncbi:MAG: hypothetical protein KY445_12995 [Armatimonadetes bacterium]|nr:hypothetical protein [Armatimonadota bacterium]
MKLSPEKRWEQGTLTPDEVQAETTKEHTAFEWKLINTITNLQGLLPASAGHRT